MMVRAQRDTGVLPVLIILVFMWGSIAQAERWPAVREVDLSQISLDDFADEELGLLYHLVHLHRVANAVVEHGEHRGFIDLPVWRSPEQNRPDNARVLENHVALAFFYCADRPWNPYRGDPALRVRMEAILDYWSRTQLEDGRFFEIPNNINLAGTSFGVMMMGRTLRLLHDGPPIDPQIHQRTIAATRKAIETILTRADMYRYGTEYSNQYTGMFGGAQQFLQLYPDERLSELLLTRMRESVDDFHSPAGFVYEKSGPDWAYTLQTHANNMSDAWQFARETERAPPLLESEKMWTQWLAYNAVLEPGRNWFTLNRAVETRTSLAGFAHWSTPLAEHDELARAFAQSSESVVASRQALRGSLQRDWPNVSVPPLTRYSPHVFVNLDDYRWHPTSEQIELARKQLPYLASERFNHQRVDSRRPIVFSYIRRPGYYAAFVSGPIPSYQQRYGFTLLWHPEMGSVLQSQSRSIDHAFGTRVGDDLYEAKAFDATYRVGEREIATPPGVRDLDEGELEASYSLGSEGRKTITFADEQIIVRVEHPGEFREQIPLLSGESDEFRISEEQIILHRPQLGRVIIDFDRPVQVGTVEQTLNEGPWRSICVHVQARDALIYHIRLESSGD